MPEAGAAARCGAGLELEGRQAEEDGGHSRRPARPDRAAQGVCCGQSQMHTLPDCHLVILLGRGGGGCVCGCVRVVVVCGGRGERMHRHRYH